MVLKAFKLVDELKFRLWSLINGVIAELTSATVYNFMVHFKYLLPVSQNLPLLTNLPFHTTIVYFSLSTKKTLDEIVTNFRTNDAIGIRKLTLKRIINIVEWIFPIIAPVIKIQIKAKEYKYITQQKQNINCRFNKATDKFI